MSRALLLLVAALALALPAAAAASDAHPTASELEAELVCPTCHTTLDQSDSAIAERMKAYVRRRIAEGATGTQIKAELVDQFGEDVLATPPTHGFDVLAWALPLGGIGLGVVGVGALALAWSRRRGDGGGDDPGGEPLDPELERRVDEELARFDA